MSETNKLPESVERMINAVAPLVDSPRQGELIIEAICDALHRSEPIYIPSGQNIRRRWRDAAIQSQFDGRNIKDIARRRGVSTRHVRRILKNG